MIKGDLVADRPSPWVTILAVLGLSACAAEPTITHPNLSRPQVLNRIQPSHGGIVLARTQASLPPARSLPSRPTRAAMVNLPKPLLAEVITPEKPLQCVPYARSLSNLDIRGDAWTWWGQAEGRYRRGATPRPGAVMVLKRKGRSRGHVAYVNEIVDNRVIIVSHANWLNEGRIHKNVPVMDVSDANDWSEIRLWHTPGKHFGGRVYKPYGFIYGDRAVASAR
jgi:hypothetical protein